MFMLVKATRTGVTSWTISKPPPPPSQMPKQAGQRAGSKGQSPKGIVKKIDIKKCARPTNHTPQSDTADALSETNHIERPDLYAK